MVDNTPQPNVDNRPEQKKPEPVDKQAQRSESDAAGQPSPPERHAAPGRKPLFGR